MSFAGLPEDAVPVRHRHVYVTTDGDVRDGYLSTGCLHDDHDYCSAMTGVQGAKRPARCKFCAAGCVCPCHS